MKRVAGPRKDPSLNHSEQTTSSGVCHSTRFEPALHASLSNFFGAQVRSPHQRSPSEDSGQDDRRNDNLLRSQALSVIELAVARSHGETHAEDDAVRRVIQAGPDANVQCEGTRGEEVKKTRPPIAYTAPGRRHY